MRPSGKWVIFFFLVSSQSELFYTGSTAWPRLCQISFVFILTSPLLLQEATFCGMSQQWCWKGTLSRKLQQLWCRSNTLLGMAIYWMCSIRQKSRSSCRIISTSELERSMGMAYLPFTSQMGELMRILVWISAGVSRQLLFPNIKILLAAVISQEECQPFHPEWISSRISLSFFSS